TVDFEAGYIRHLSWHQQAQDPWAWYGWTVTFGERQRWFVYATFNHSAAAFDSAVAPGDDERDNVLNVAPHVDAWENALYEFLPALSRGSGEPQAGARVEMTIVELNSGNEKAFESAIGANQPTLRDETLWYRMIAGGAMPRYVRLMARRGYMSIIDSRSEQILPDATNRMIARTTVEILTLRPTMSLGIGALIRC